jgi:hypothetical protein
LTISFIYCFIFFFLSFFQRVSDRELNTTSKSNIYLDPLSELKSNLDFVDYAHKKIELTNNLYNSPCQHCPKKFEHVKKKTEY